MTATGETLFPTIYGGEQEASLRHLHMPGKDGAFKVEDIDRAITGHQRNPKHGIVTWGMSYPGKIDSTGGALSRDSHRLELGSPEYRTIEELAARTEDNERRLGEIAADHVTDHARCTGVGLDLRAVDSVGNTAGPQYSFGYPEVDSMMTHGRTIMPFMGNYFVTRALITGAGLVRPGGLYYSQKFTAQRWTTFGQGFPTNLLSLKDEEGGLRIESRNPDFNLCSAALKMEIGGTAIALAVAQSPHVTEYHQKMLGEDAPYDFMNRVSALNHMHFDEDGNLTLLPLQREALKFQMSIDETFLTELVRYEPSPELVAIAEKRLAFCEDMLNVGADEKLQALAGRADWAAKMFIVRRHIKRDQAEGQPRTMNDLQAQKDDMAYSAIQVKRTPDGPKIMRAGYAFKLRDRGQFEDPVPTGMVDAARQPPRDTRAFVRSGLLRKYVVSDVRWGRVMLPQKDGSTAAIHLDVLDTAVPDDYQRVVDNAWPRRGVR
ncbi:MAG TPA: proteasome accessory factor PafA2 family protein [Candidatus Saccharimonadales bacterium]|nr:proteasome accessory factor PafA2 family protein [Candidatus Saccharimonadales bacterium]